jgi:hypothetical protein
MMKATTYSQQDEHKKSSHATKIMVPRATMGSLCLQQIIIMQKKGIQNNLMQDYSDLAKAAYACARK